MNQLRRKVVVSSEQPIKKDQKAIGDKHNQKHGSDQQEQAIQSMANRKEPSRIATQQLRNPNRHNKSGQVKEAQQKPATQQNTIKPPRKLLMYHRHKAEEAEVDSEGPKIVIKPSEKKGQDFEDNSNKMPYRFQC